MFEHEGLAVEVSEASVRLLGRSGEVVDAWSSTPWAIRDFDADPSGGYLFLVLGASGSDTGGRVAVLSCSGGKIVCALTGRDRGLSPWKIRVGDVEGDGALEVCVGVSAPRVPGKAPQRRLHVYGWESGRLVPKWLGSKMSMPLVDFDVHDVDGDGVSELVCLERQKNALTRVMVYEWKGVGFEGVRELGIDLRFDCLADFDGPAGANRGGAK